MFRSDNGTEFCNAKFEKFFQNEGIIHQKSAPYVHKQNGLAERLNRTLIERIKCMLLDASLDQKFWAEAIVTAAYLINRTPCRDQNTTTPYELWT